MARILLTSGPTRQYIDPVRYLTNASSGRMGCSLAEAALAAGHEVVIVSGPVSITYPSQATVHWVDTTDEMLAAAREQFEHCEGLIGVAAPCDYRPEFVLGQKIAKTGQPLVLQLIETPDVVATLGAEKKDRWVVGFALETEDRRFRALTKLEKKSCDLMILNGPEAMNSEGNHVEVLAKDGSVVATLKGSKPEVAVQIMQIVGQRLIQT
ncbi:Coenzyme A biosynthesis bifunctional protein CoaBC [Bremerella volcania]|uniref:Coenzyme A biosynthesis bifunctional protein CoaBC n=1 Tax=Bremerella volcania TaxID=2527984 RepID=A0A518CBQ9_9BACT|nr:phosphopantothenoylcysteine decarboxylase [Bremerella volcania]QDU76614.1 Coenzyme A biosynthesis bifunctional protein CoaBC [Bremerella volcania]